MIRLLTDLMRDSDDARSISLAAADLKFFTPK
jgi:hypothetical protein